MPANLKFAKFTIGLSAATLLCAPGLAVQADVNPATEAAHWTPILMKTVEPPRPFEGIDGLTNLVYEVILTNYGTKPLKLIEFQALDKDNVLLSLTKNELLKNLTKGGKASAADMILPPASMAIVWLNISVKDSKSVPTEITHKLIFKDITNNKEETAQVVGTAVNAKSPIHIGPPLLGKDWIANNCYDGIPHRRALFPVSNGLHSSQRYAIDWTKLDDQKRALTGNPLDVKSYPAYGQPIIAVADGTILGVIDQFPDQVPGTASKNMSFPGGNTIIMSLPEGAYAFYAHIKPGSIAVKEGDKVKRGQVLGHVGNVGNSSEPHLHFHVTDKPTIFAANSLPYAIDNFEVVGKIADDHILDAEKLSKRPVTIEKPAYIGQHQNQMPKEGSIITFGQ